MIEICLFAGEWQTTVYGDIGFCHIIYHPLNKHPFIYLVKKEKEIEVFDSNEISLGLLKRQGMHGKSSQEPFFLIAQKRQATLYYFYRLENMCIGRSDACSVTVKESYISNQHVSIQWHGNKLMIKDLNSTNGTYVNGKRIKECIGECGDVIRIGMLQLIVGVDFIAVNRPVSLEVVQPQLTVNKPLIYANPLSVQWSQPAEEWMNHNLSVPPVVIRQEEMLFLLQVGPGITMAVCSMLAMRTMMSGKWMQLSLLLCMVVWPSLAFCYRRIKARKDRRKCRQSYKKKLEHEIHDIVGDRYQYVQKQRKLVTMLCEEMVLLQGLKVPLVYLGECNKQLIKAGDEADSDADEVCKKIWTEAMKKLERPKQMPVCVPVSHTVWICGNDALNFALFVLMQLLKQFGQNVMLYVYGFEDLRVLGRLRFLTCFCGKIENGSLNAISKKADDEKVILLSRNTYCSLSSDKKRTWEIICSRHARGGSFNELAINLDRKEYWNEKVIDFFPYRYSMKQWEQFCICFSKTKRYRSNEVKDFLSLFQCTDIIQLDIMRRWSKAKKQSLSVPVGWDENDQLIFLDAHERADGPHGIIAGTTGAGKSELLITYILSLACEYPPDQVNFFLIDYKGGAMAKALCDLPHISGIMTNLEAASLQRVRISLSYELTLRQREFQRLTVQKHVSSLSMEDYGKLRLAEQPEFAHLFLIVDEFAQLRSQYYEFLEDLKRIARIGRSFGIHLLLCTQKPGGLIDDQIWSNSNFHLCMRVQEAADSRDMLHNNDAVYLNKSGEFLLQVGAGSRYQHGFSAYANADYCPSTFYHRNAEHNLRINDANGKTIYCRCWRDKQAKTKQLQAICDYLQVQASECKKRARKICCEELVRYASRNSFSHPYQIGWIDVPQKQSIQPWILKEGSLAVLCASSAQTRVFFDTCISALVKENERHFFYIGDRREGMETIAPDDERMMALLFYHLEQSSNECVFIEDMHAFLNDPQLIDIFFKLSEKHQLLISIRSVVYRITDKMPQKIVRTSYEINDKELLREWFRCCDIPLMQQKKCGVLERNGNCFAYICGCGNLNGLAANGTGSLKESPAAKAVGLTADKKLYFLETGVFTLLIYAQRGAEEKICRLLVSWGEEIEQSKEDDTCILTKRFCIGWAGNQKVRELAHQYRYEGKICWIGCGLEEYGHLFGFRSCTCSNDEMIVRMSGKEEHVQLWKKKI